MLCRLYQYQMDLQLNDERTMWSPRLNRHLERCGRCRAYAGRLKALAETLRTHPPVIISKRACRSLTANAIEYVERGVFSETLCEKPAGIYHAKRFSAAIAAGLLIVAGLLMVDFNRNLAIRQAASPLSVGSEVLQNPVGTMAEWSEKPLRTELDKLVTGARKAAVFLWNCVPGHLEQPADTTKTQDTSKPGK